MSLRQTGNIAFIPYPFGSSLKTRAFSAGSGFRFGFNTQEKDKKVYNNNETYTATFWEYDGRLGRRWNVDPKSKVSLSKYACFANNPIITIDHFGDTIKIEGSKKFVENTTLAIEQIKSTNEGKRIYDKLNSSKRKYTIREFETNVTKVNADSDLPVNWVTGDIGITGNDNNNADEFMGKNGWISLGHELSHTEDVEDGIVSDETWQTPDLEIAYDKIEFSQSGYYYFNGTQTQKVKPILIDEIRAMDRENKMRAQSGMQLRTHYNLVEIRLPIVPYGPYHYEYFFTQQVVNEQGIGTHPAFNTNYNLLRKDK